MANKKEISQIKKDLVNFSNFDVIVFGSYVEGSYRDSSDIDIAIISHNSNENENIELFKQLLGKIRPPYELHIFELLPIHIKMSIINNHEVIFGKRIELSEYFYQFRKVWEDCKHRFLSNQFESYKEKLELSKANAQK